MTTYIGTGADETLQGSDAADTFNDLTTPRVGSDTVQALGGDDVITTGTESGDSGQILTVDAGAGNDTVNYDIDHAAGLSRAVFLGGDGSDNFTFVLDDTSAPADGSISVDGGAGTDTLTVQGAALLPSLLLSGLEHLSVTGASAPVTLSTEQIAGAAGSISLPTYSTYVSLSGELTSVSYGTGAGSVDHVLYVSDGGTVDLSASAISNLAIFLSNSETSFTGTAARDVIITQQATAIVHGAEGNDVILAGVRQGETGDQLFGGPGDDLIYAGGSDFYGQTYYAVGTVFDGGDGSDALTAFLKFDHASINLNDIATAAGLTLPDGTLIRNIEQANLTITGDHNVAWAGAVGGLLSLQGSDTTIYAGSGTEALSATAVYVTAQSGKIGINNGYASLAYNGQDVGTSTGIAHIDYSGASSSVSMSDYRYYGSHGSVSAYDLIAINGGSSTQFTGDADITGGGFNDTLVGSNFFGINNLNGGGGDDTIQPSTATAGVFDGGSGVNTVDFTPGYSTPGQPSSVTIDLGLTGAQAAGYTLLNIQNVVGSSGDDHITGGATANVLSGGGGGDTLIGGAGDDVLIGGPGDDSLDGGAGNDTAVFAETYASATVRVTGAGLIVTGPDGSDAVTGVEHLQFSDGVYDVDAQGRLTFQLGVSQTALSDGGVSLGGGAGADTLTGGGGNDTLTGGGASDVVNGGAGSDTVVYSGYARDYSIAATGGNGAVTGGPEGGTDTLVSIENLHFLDGVLTTDEQSDAARIVRLYDSFLGRAPDAAGFEGYLRFVAAGHSFQDIAANAAASPEFAQATASLNDTQYVTYVYEHSLHREPDATGLATYVADLENGTFTRTSMIVQAAESPEHVALTAGFVAPGLWVPNEHVEGLQLLYDAAVQREPDSTGLAGYGDLLNTGTTLKQIANQMASSAEFQAAHGSQSDAAYIDSLYVAELGRHADPAGLAAYEDQLSHGYTRGDLLYETAFSAEHQGHVLYAYDPLLG